MAVKNSEPISFPPEVAPAHRRRVLVRLAGELGTKSPRTRRRFLATLVGNAQRALRSAGVHGTVRQQWSRVWVDVSDPGQVPEARRAVADLFGTHSAVEVLEVPAPSLSALVTALEPIYRERVRGHTFGVRARRAGGTSMRSQDLAVELGAALLPVSSGVDLDHPAVEVQVLLGEDRAYACLEESSGPGGLPLGTGGRALALLSGGFDSPVAAWHVMRRGVDVELVHFDLGGCGQVDAAMEVARALVARWAPGISVPVHVIDLAPLVTALEARCDRRLRQVLLKRAMYRAAGQLGRQLGVEALVTGEALAQVSTQTLRSLAVCEEAAGMIVLRPLIGMDKTEIIARATAIGTREASEGVQEVCAIAGGKVITWPHLESVRLAEAGVAEEATDAWAAGQVASRRVIETSDREPVSPGVDGREVDGVPEGAVLVDVREPYEGQPVGELQLPYSVALERIELLESDRDYVLVCTTGQRSAVLAGRLCERGYRAFSLRGGLRRLPPSGGMAAGRPGYLNLMSDANDFNTSVVAEFRANSGKVGGMFAGMPMLLLTTVGARSGKERTNPLAYTRAGDRYVIIASKGGAPTNPEWYHNLVANPTATVEVGQERFQVRASVAQGEERDRLYAAQAAMLPNFAEYQRNTTRRIPVFTLERT